MTESQPQPTENRNDDDYMWHGRHRDGRWHDRSGNAVCWALILIWVGLGILGETTGWGHRAFGWWNGWAVILAGAGAIMVICAAVRFIAGHHHVLGNLIPGVVLLGVGLGALTTWGWGIIIGIVLVVVGVAIILGAVFRRSSG